MGLPAKPLALTGACVDAKGLFEAQLYKCADSAN
jgi:hypothetical protein